MTRGAVEPRSGAPLGLYIHVPFCAHHCPYCDYPVVEGQPASDDPYRAAVVEEIEARDRCFAGRSLETIYLGGGTPSSVPTGWVERWVRVVRQQWPEAEPTITLEANPEDVDVERLAAWGSAGVDRLIVGLQSLQGETLDRLGRLHTPEEGWRALQRASADDGLDVGVDLLFGVAGQEIREWREDLEQLVDAENRPAGLYLYEYAPTTGASDRPAPGPSDDAAEMFELGKEAAAAMGLTRTGVASFETPAFASRHTRGYWNGWEYFGVGMAASSLRLLDEGDGAEAETALRRRNAGELGAYLEDPVGAFEAERLDARAYFIDRLALGMRAAVGIDWEEIGRQFGGALSDAVLRRGRRVLERLVDSGRAEQRESRIRPTDAGLDVADAVDRELRRELLGEMD